MARKNAEFYARYPEDAHTVRRIANHLEAHVVHLPDGDRFTLRRFRMLGSGFGMGDGYDKHALAALTRRGTARSSPTSSSTACSRRPPLGRAAVRAAGVHLWPAGLPPTAWAAERAISQHPEFAADHDPLLFTGEMFYRWMFEEIAALRPFLGAADLLASYDDWPPSTTSTGSPPTRCRCARPST